jgi:1-acyl-sn-glycerol-3-phosphate acyltransferase
MADLYGLLIRILITVWCYFIFIMGCIVWGGLGIPLTLLLSHFWPSLRDRFNDGTQRILGAYIRRLPFIELEIDRSRRSTSDRSIVLVMNHQSFLDPIVMLSLEPRLSGPARGYMFRVPIVRSVLKLGRFFLSDSGAPAPLERMRDGVQEALDRRGTLLFYPEGSRTRTGEIEAFHHGAFRMAVEYQLPIQPVVTDGLHRVLPPGSLILQTLGRHPVQVRYLDPIEPPYGEGLQRRVVRDLAQRVRLAMVEELKALRSEPKALRSERKAASE